MHFCPWGIIYSCKWLTFLLFYMYPPSLSLSFFSLDLSIPCVCVVIAFKHYFLSSVFKFVINQVSSLYHYLISALKCTLVCQSPNSRFYKVAKFEDYLGCEGFVVPCRIEAKYKTSWYFAVLILNKETIIMMYKVIYLKMWESRSYHWRQNICYVKNGIQMSQHFLELMMKTND